MHLEVEKDKFDKTISMTDLIDTKIELLFEDGNSIDEVISELNSRINRASIKIADCIKNNHETRYKYLYTHNQVCIKRIGDLEYINKLIKNEKYASYTNKKLHEIIKFRDKFSKKFRIKIPEFKHIMFKLNK